MKFVSKYSRWVSNHPFKMLIIVLMAIFISMVLSSRVGTESMDNKGILPKGIAVLDAFDVIGDNFGGSDSIKLVVEIEPRFHDSNEIRDVRDPRAIEFVYLLARLAEGADDVESVSSAGTILKSSNNDVLPKTKREVISYMEQGILDNYISSDYEMSIVSVSLIDGYDEKEIVQEMQKVLEHIKTPPGLVVNVGGDVATGPVIEGQIGPDMARTSNFAMIGIIIVLFILFLSIRYALTPLTVIGVGIVWTFGFLGLIGTNISSITSAAISMIMGIGIDFGIQTVNRFRQELKKVGSSPSKAMEITLNNVFWPMATTTIAALIGFRAMMMGKLSIMKSLAEIMSYGVFFCFLAAITVVPVIAIIGENVILRIKSRRTKK